MPAKELLFGEICVFGGEGERGTWRKLALRARKLEELLKSQKQTRLAPRYPLYRYLLNSDGRPRECLTP